MKKITIVYFDAGSGHRSAAWALESVLKASHADWEINSVNILDIFAYHKRFHDIVQRGIDHFNDGLKKETIFDLGGMVNLSLLFHDLVKEQDILDISRYWANNPPDAVVSVTPMYNPVLYRSVRAVKPDVLCITIPVDFEEFKRRYWFTPKVPQHYILATRRLADQARKVDILEQFIHCIPGMIIDPTFYSEPPADCCAEIEKLGLDPALPTGLASFGGQGSVMLVRIAKALARSDLKLNMIFLCGRNPAVIDEIEALQTPYHKLALCYTDEPPSYYHHLADFVIGKPGSMTITEALVTGKPLIFMKSVGMAPVQRGNEQWVLEHGVGTVARFPRNVPAAIKQVFVDNRYHQNAGKYYHRGVYDAANMVSRLVINAAGKIDTTQRG